VDPCSLNNKTCAEATFSLYRAQPATALTGSMPCPCRSCRPLRSFGLPAYHLSRRVVHRNPSLL